MYKKGNLDFLKDTFLRDMGNGPDGVREISGASGVVVARTTCFIKILWKCGDSRHTLMAGLNFNKYSFCRCSNVLK